MWPLRARLKISQFEHTVQTLAGRRSARKTKNVIGGRPGIVPLRRQGERRPGIGLRVVIGTRTLRRTELTAAQLRTGVHPRQQPREAPDPPDFAQRASTRARGELRRRVVDDTHVGIQRIAHWQRHHRQWATDQRLPCRPDRGHPLVGIERRRNPRIERIALPCREPVEHAAARFLHAASRRINAGRQVATVDRARQRYV